MLSHSLWLRCINSDTYVESKLCARWDRSRSSRYVEWGSIQRVHIDSAQWIYRNTGMCECVCSSRVVCFNIYTMCFCQKTNDGNRCPHWGSIDRSVRLWNWISSIFDCLFNSNDYLLTSCTSYERRMFSPATKRRGCSRQPSASSHSNQKKFCVVEETAKNFNVNWRTLFSYT